MSEMSLGQRLRMLRDKHEWSLKEVADKLDLRDPKTGKIRFSTYSNWEYDRTKPTINSIEKLAELYKVDVQYLLTGRSPEMIDYSYNLKELLNGINLRWGEDGDILTEEQKAIAIQKLDEMLAEQKDT